AAPADLGGGGSVYRPAESIVSREPEVGAEVLEAGASGGVVGHGPLHAPPESSAGRRTAPSPRSEAGGCGPGRGSPRRRRTRVPVWPHRGPGVRRACRTAGAGGS